MKSKACLIVPILLLLSACGHFRGGDDAVSTEVPDTTTGITKSGQNADPKSNDSSSSDADEEAPIGPPMITLSDAEEAAAKVAPPVSEAVPPIDLFERMRRGFKFPKLKSKYVSEYEHWDATHPTYLTNLFVRATPFLYHIVEEIDKRGLPMELALLPAVESAYKPEATSRSSAGGLWQFIPSTGRQFGLREDWWYDGRRDALSSTKAALDYLEQLNAMFDGDWFLTLAAYNAGPGTVMRARKSNSKRRKGTDYQSLKLRSETRRYVPKLIALKNIIENPQEHGITLPEIASQQYFEVVELPGQIDLNKFAADAQIDIDLLRHLNAGFKRWATSPEGPHRLLIPIGDGDLIARAEAAIAAAPKIKYRNHRIARGDTLGGIARQHGVSVAALKKANNLRSTRIREGKNLMIPTRGALITAEGPASVNSEQTVHRVRRGDTLWSIARQYKVGLKDLMAWNNLAKGHILRLNQSVLLRPKALN